MNQLVSLERKNAFDEFPYYAPEQGGFLSTCLSPRRRTISLVVVLEPLSVRKPYVFCIGTTGLKFDRTKLYGTVMTEGR